MLAFCPGSGPGNLKEAAVRGLRIAHTQRAWVPKCRPTGRGAAAAASGSPGTAKGSWQAHE